jgi:primosomal protein N' (replication factor Y)
MAIDIQIGSTVVIPFGKTERLGYVIALPAKPEHENHSDIIAVVDEPPAFDATIAELAAWTSERYVSSLSAALRLALPPGRGRRLKRDGVDAAGNPRYVLTKPLVNVKTEGYARLLVPKDQALAASDKAARAPKQAYALRALVDGPLPLHRLASEGGVKAAALKPLVERGLVGIYREDTFREPDFTYPEELALDFILTPDQKVALDKITEPDAQGESPVFLLHGVTGSGKTEVYLRAIAATMAAGKSAIILVPEIALTPQTVSRFRSRFGDKVAVLHSGLGLGERFDQWQRIRRGDCKVVVGARSAIWAPVSDLGLIVVDEEHETSYKQDNDPRYSARAVAIYRAKISGARVVLGSATPSIESRYSADKDDFTLIKMPSRIADRPMPAVEIIDMREEPRHKGSSNFSERLVEGLRETLDQGDKAIVFLNRRGFANFLICRDCGAVINCKRCNVSLTYHISGRYLLCHHCGYRSNAPKECPECGSAGIGYFGSGTERVEAELKELFPDSPITRMDSDTTGAKDAHRRHLAEFKTREGGILLGTQMIAKGLDFPDVTAVGIINADTALNLPDFRAGERTFQLMTQVSGRAGRGDKPGTVYIQTYNPENYAIQALAVGDYDRFYENEAALREALDYPPFCELINVIMTAGSEEAVRREADDIAASLQEAGESGALTGVREILGPAPAPLSKIKNKYRMHIVMKTDGSPAPRAFLRELSGHKRNRQTVSGASLTIDVDPVSLL